MGSQILSRSQGEEDEFSQVDEPFMRVIGRLKVDRRATAFEYRSEDKPLFTGRISATGNMKNGKFLVEENGWLGPAIAWEKPVAPVKNGVEAHNHIPDYLLFVPSCGIGDGKGNRVTSSGNLPVWRDDNSSFVCCVGSVGCCLGNMACSPQLYITQRR